MAKKPEAKEVPREKAHIPDFSKLGTLGKGGSFDVLFNVGIEDDPKNEIWQFRHMASKIIEAVDFIHTSDAMRHRAALYDSDLDNITAPLYCIIHPKSVGTNNGYKPIPSKPVKEALSELSQMSRRAPYPRLKAITASIL